MSRTLLSDDLSRELRAMKNDVEELKRTSSRNFGSAGSATDVYKTALPFASGWTNRDTPPSGFEQCTYSRIGKLIILQGLATKTSGVPTSGEIMATLPSGFRPTGSLTFVQRMTNVAGEFQIGWVDVNASGTIVVYPSGTAVETDFISLAGITFVNST